MTRADATVAGLVLGAGAGRRLGQPKAGVVLDGKLLVDRAGAVLQRAGCSPVVVVLGAEAADVRARAQLSGVTVVVNQAWESGLSSSLACGLTHIASSPAAAVVVVLVDQPLVSPAAISRLVSAWRSGAAAATATFGGSPRPPVLLDRGIWEEVMRESHADSGARSWLRAHREDVVFVPCEDVAADDDIDTLDDLHRIRRIVAAEAAGRCRQGCAPA